MGSSYAYKYGTNTFYSFHIGGSGLHTFIIKERYRKNIRQKTIKTTK